MIGRNLKFIQALIVSIAIIGCDSKKSNDMAESDVNLKASRLLDDNRPKEAITLLESELDKNPQDNKIRMSLVSAYAYIGGVRISRLIKMFKSLESLKAISEPYPEISDSMLDSEKSSLNALKVAMVLEKSAVIFRTYQNIPTLTTDDGNYLKQAIVVAKDLVDPSQEDSLYKAILELIYLKHILATQVFSSLGVADIDQKKSCKPDIGRIHDSFLEIGNLMIDMYSDAAIAHPKMSERLKSLSEQTANQISDLTIASTGLILLDEASILFLNKALIQQGFTKLLNCEEPQS